MPKNLSKISLLRIGIDFDNTLICYDQVFCNLAKSWQLVDKNFQGNKRSLQESICKLAGGDLIWQRMQGKVYGEFLHQATLFAGFKDFLVACNNDKNSQIFIVSHKTEFGHFDEKKINLQDTARAWLHNQYFFSGENPLINENHVFFETTQEKKIDRINSLQCTHFIDDLVEVFESPLFPRNIERILFQPQGFSLKSDKEAIQKEQPSMEITCYSTWVNIKNAFFS